MLIVDWENNECDQRRSVEIEISEPLANFNVSYFTKEIMAVVSLGVLRGISRNLLSQNVIEVEENSPARWENSIWFNYIFSLVTQF